VHLQEQGGPRGQRATVILDPGSVRGPDLDELGAGSRQDVGQAELTADLDQLAPRDEHLATPRERGERQHEGRGVVVHDERVLGAGERGEQELRARRAPSTLAGAPVHLQVRGGRCGPGGCACRFLRQARSSQVRV
jgi:hypothetical protein